MTQVLRKEGVEEKFKNQNFGTLKKDTFIVFVPATSFYVFL